MISLQKMGRKIQRLAAERNTAEAVLRRESKALNEAREQLRASGTAQVIVQEVAQIIQQKAHDKIASAVTKCLEVVFNDPYEFHIRFNRKRGKTEAQLILRRDGVDRENPLSEVGGGVIDVASLALRLSCVMLSNPVRDRVLILDEPFRNVRGSANKQRLRGLLQSLADEMGFQFVLNVDAQAYPEFVLGKTVELEGSR